MFPHWDCICGTPTDPETSKRYALYSSEEQVIVEYILRCTDRFAPLHHRYVKEEAEIVIESMSEERRKSLPFRDGKPGSK